MKLVAEGQRFQPGVKQQVDVCRRSQALVQGRHDEIVFDNVPQIGGREPGAVELDATAAAGVPYRHAAIGTDPPRLYFRPHTHPRQCPIRGTAKGTDPQTVFDREPDH